MSTVHSVIPCTHGSEKGAQGSPTDPKPETRPLGDGKPTFQIHSLYCQGTTVVYHDIVTKPGRKVRLKLYCTPEARREAFCEVLKQMLCLNIIEESSSAWSSLMAVYDVVMILEN